MSGLKYIVIIMGVLLVGSILLRPGTCAPAAPRTVRPADAKIADLSVEGQPAAGAGVAPYSFTIRAEVADTPAARRQGLAGRAGLEPGFGMLYVYDAPQEVRFSEATVAFPLSVAFIRSDGTIVKIGKTAPRDPALLISDQSVRYVLEVRDGWFDDRGIREGARLVIPAELVAAKGQAVPAESAPATQG